MGQSQNWAFTYFADPDWTLEDFAAYALSTVDTTMGVSTTKSIIASIAWGEETCPKTGREHFQGFLQTYTKRMRARSRGACIVLPCTSASGLADSHFRRQRKLGSRYPACSPSFLIL